MKMCFVEKAMYKMMMEWYAPAGPVQVERCPYILQPYVRAYASAYMYASADQSILLVMGLV